MEKTVGRYLETLSPLECVSQIFMINVQGDEFFIPVEENLAGSILLFSYNIAGDSKTFFSYIQSIADYAEKNDKIPPFICVDQEGGVVNRLRDITSTLPSASFVAKQMGPEKAQKLYSAQAKQLKALGIDINLSPVAEPVSVLNRDFLSSRSYGSVQDTILYSIISIRAYEENGIMSVVKHFPGNSGTDPHTGLPHISLSNEYVFKDYAGPFSFVLNAGPSCVLMSHAVVDSVDYGVPSCLSSVWISDVLKNKFNYDGLIISDDIFMDALNKNGFTPEKACELAVLAGVDIIMISEKRCADAALSLIEKSKENPLLEQMLFNAEKKVLMQKWERGLVDFYAEEDKVVLLPGKKTASYEDFLAAKNEGRLIFETER